MNEYFQKILFSGGPVRLFLSLAVAVGASASAFADTAIDSRIHHEYTSTRALGMGDAFVAVADDYSGLFYNPASMAWREDGHLNMYIQGGIGSDIFGFAKEVSDASKTPGTDAQKQKAMLTAFESAYGKTFSGNLSLPNAIMVRPGWGIGIIPLNLTLHSSVHKQLGPSLNTTVYSDTIVAYGMAKEYGWFPDAKTAAGFNVKFVNRGYFSKSIAAIDAVADPKLVQTEDFREGATVDADFGMLYRPEIPEEGIFSLFKFAKPTFGAVLRNSLDYGFKSDLNLYNKEKTVEAPEQLFRRIDIGSRWEYPELWIFGGRGTLDFRDILHPNISLRKSMHLGFEFDWRMFSWWKGNYRFGLNQGYLTAGITALFSIFNLDLVTYSEDIGSANSPKESRKYEMRMSLDF